MDVVTVDQGYLAVDNEEFGVERTQQKTVEVLSQANDRKAWSA